MAGPVATVEIAFTTDPLTVPGTWTDISAYVRGINIKRGRNHELAQSQAGECTIRLKNTDRRFDPLYTSGAYYPNVLPMRQIRITATHNSVTYPLFYGYVEDWSQTWPGKPKSATGDAECVLHAVDGFKLLSLYESRNTYAEEVLADSPVVYWKLGEPTGSTQLESTVPLAGSALSVRQGTTMGFTPGPLLGGSSVLDSGGIGASDLGAMSDYLDNPPFLANPAIEFWVNPDTITAGKRLVMYQDTAGITPFDVSIADGSGHLALVFYAGASRQHQTVTLTVSAGVWTHIVVSKNYTECVWFKNGAFVETTSLAFATHDVFAVPEKVHFIVAASSGVGTALDGKIAHVAVYDQGVVSPGIATNPIQPSRVAAHYATTFGDIGRGDAGTQISSLLDVIGWSAGLRDIDTGASLMQAFDAVGSALGHILASAEDSEGGLVQMSADGKVTFHSRTSLLASTGSHGVSQATFGDAGAELPYETVEFRYDDQDLWTRVVVQRNGGAPEKQEDAAAIAAYGPRTLSRDAPRLVSDTDSEVFAAYLLRQYRTPRVRPISVGFVLGSDNTLNAAVLGRETHHDRVTVVRRPVGGGSAISFEAHVEGISYEIRGQDPWQVNLALVPEPGVRFIFDELLTAPGTFDGGVTESNSGTGADATLYTTTLFDGHPGVTQLSTGTTTTGRSGLLGTANAVQLGALEVMYQGYVYFLALSDGTNTYTARVGLGDSVAAESVDFVGFRYTHGTNSGRWQGVCRSNSVESVVDTGINGETLHWWKLGFTINLAGTSVQFYMDDVAVGAPITTNIPTGGSRLLTYLPGFILKSAGTTSRSLLVDRYAYIISP